MLDEEIAFLSSLLNNPKSIGCVANKVKAEHFTDQQGKLLYQAILDTPDFDLKTLAEKANTTLVSIINIKETLQLAKENDVIKYGFYIWDSYRKREAQRLASIGDYLGVETLARAEYFEEQEDNSSETFLKALQARISGEDDGLTIKTNFACIDEKIDGFRKAELIILGARPAMGKTTIGLNLAYNMAKDGKKILFFSLEMDKVQLHERLVRSICQLGNLKNIDEQGFNKIIKVSRAIKDRLPLKVNDKAGITIEEIMYKAREEKEKNGLDAVFVDHLSIIGTSRRFNNGHEVLKYISWQLKVLAKDLQVPVISMAQLNRGLESREIKQPNLADLRDSGSIEENADLVFFLHRPEYYLKSQQPDDVASELYFKWQEKMSLLKNKAMLILAKNRRGWSGSLNLLFDSENYLFKE